MPPPPGAAAQCVIAAADRLDPTDRDVFRAADAGRGATARARRRSTPARPGARRPSSCAQPTFDRAAAGAALDRARNDDMQVRAAGRERRCWTSPATSIQHGRATPLGRPWPGARLAAPAAPPATAPPHRRRHSTEAERRSEPPPTVEDLAQLRRRHGVGAVFVADGERKLTVVPTPGSLFDLQHAAVQSRPATWSAPGPGRCPAGSWSAGSRSARTAGPGGRGRPGRCRCRCRAR